MATYKIPSLTAGGGFATVTKIMPLGALQMRKAKDGQVSFYWRYNIRIGGVLHQGREAIGRFDAALPPKSLKPEGDRYSIAAAERAASALAEAHAMKRKEGGIIGIRSAERAEKEARRLEAQADKALSLSQLMADYADHIEERGGCHREIRSTTRCHIDPHPAAQLPARHITPDQITDILRAVFATGRKRTVNKVRSYLRAAYAVAKSARSTPSTPAHFKAYAITANPAAETAVIDAQEGKPPHGIRHLTLEQLRTYWRIIQAVPGPRGALLRLHLLTGGQRIEQLMRLARADIHDDYFIIYDSKGKRRTPRLHAVPLIPAAAQALKECAANAGGYAFTSDDGTTHISGTTLSGWAIAEAGDAIAGFTPKLIRSGIETALAAAGFSKEVRGRLQSHGISGVQDLHYDAHEYMDEKRGALETLFRLLQAPRTPAKVFQLRPPGKKGRAA